MKIKAIFYGTFGLALLAINWSVQAIPTLQLDASPATYDSTSESTISTAQNFTLYALLNSLTPDVGASYYIVAALEPAQTGPANLGSFVFNGATVNATADMTSGGPTGLPPHGIYATYYKMFGFSWNTANTFNDYDVSLVTGTHSGPTGASPGDSLYMAFTVDVSGLAPGHELWFDLVEYDANGNYVDKAPFSHSAQSPPGGGTVPDGGTTAALLGIAFIALTRVRSRFFKH